MNPDDTSRSYRNLSRLDPERLSCERLHRAGVLDAPLAGRRIGVTAVRHDRPHATSLHSLSRHHERRALDGVAGEHGRRLAGKLGEEEPEIPPPSITYPTRNPNRHKARGGSHTRGERLYSDC